MLKGRILIAKLGLDGHDRGAKVVARALKEAGFEVIYTGIHQSPSQVAEIALQEDVDSIGISILSGAHNTLIPKLYDELKKRGIENKPLVVGGIIPEEDVTVLKRIGVREVYGPGTSLKDIIKCFENLIIK